MTSPLHAGRPQSSIIILPRKRGETPPHPPQNFQFSNNDLCLFYSSDELDQYADFRALGLAKKSQYWIYRSKNHFWNSTEGEITARHLVNLRQEVYSKYKSRDSWSKYLNFGSGFLKHLATTQNDHRFHRFISYMALPKSRREIKLLTPRIIVDQDIRRVLNEIEGSNLPPTKKAYYKALILFLAYSGQRVMTASQLTVEQFSVALNSNPPVLTVEAAQDKIRMAHYVPLHPKIIPLLDSLVENRSNALPMFDYTGLMLWLRKKQIPLDRTDGVLQLKDLRKFFEQKSDEIGFIDANKNFIMSHGVSSINWQSYKQFLPENVHRKYIEVWGDVSFDD